MKVGHRKSPGPVGGWRSKGCKFILDALEMLHVHARKLWTSKSCQTRRVPIDGVNIIGHACKGLSHRGRACAGTDLQERGAGGADLVFPKRPSGVLRDPWPVDREEKDHEPLQPPCYGVTVHGARCTEHGHLITAIFQSALLPPTLSTPM